MNENIRQTVEAMINEIGKLRASGVAIDNMPIKLQTIRQLLREIDYELHVAGEE